MTITSDNDIYALLRQGESASVEIKKCSDSLPRSVWETYSAFANTRGGVILLGITEHKDRPLESRYEITGVTDYYKVITDFFNIVNNKQKVNRSVLVSSDVRPVEVDGVIVVYIKVPEADYRQKPIYINNNLQSGTFKRTHEGDRHVTEEELTLLIRDSSDNADLRIDRRTDKIVMRNPGTLRISPERIYNGDYTQARNSTIQKMLRMVGFGDNIGSGFRKIMNAWKVLGYSTPDIHEEDEVNEVWLTLPLTKSKDVNDSINDGVNNNDSVNEGVNEGVNDGVNEGVNDGVNDGVNEGVNVGIPSETKTNQRQKDFSPDKYPYR